MKVGVSNLKSIRMCYWLPPSKLYLATYCLYTNLNKTVRHARSHPSADCQFNLIIFQKTGVSIETICTKDLNVKRGRALYKADIGVNKVYRTGQRALLSPQETLIIVFPLKSLRFLFFQGQVNNKLFHLVTCFNWHILINICITYHGIGVAIH